MPAISQGLIDFALAPPLGALTTHLDEDGPFGPGNWIRTTYKVGGVDFPVNDTFGVVAQFNGAIPLHLGRLIGFDDGLVVSLDLFSDRLLQLVVLHQLLSGAWVASQVEEIHSLPFVTRWLEALPGKIGLYVLPTIAVDLYYLRVA